MTDRTNLYKTAKALVTARKGILAADQSPGTMDRQLTSIGVKPNPETRRRYRELLFTTEGIEEFVSGIILHDGTIRNQASDGTPFVDIIMSKGAIPIIKVDLGTVPHDNFPGEVVTQGLDGLAERFREYYEMGARAAKWRAVVTIGENTPTLENLRLNGFFLARYAALAQTAGLVPMIEPEVLYSGSHSLERARQVTIETLRTVFSCLLEQRVDLKAVILKSSMVLAGSECPTQSSSTEVAEATLSAFDNSVPEDVPGIVFLSGGQTPVRATENLNAIARKEAKDGPYPWQLAFSFSRGIEEPVQKTWLGRADNIPDAQAELRKRLRLNSLADSGLYTAEMENE